MNRRRPSTGKETTLRYGRGPPRSIPDEEAAENPDFGAGGKEQDGTAGKRANSLCCEGVI
jgi:hypothetical protein